MTSAEVERAVSGYSIAAAAGFPRGRALRPRGKVLPEYTRAHNRALVLQTLYRSGRLSRADIARETGLTRVTISDLVGELIGEGLVVELGQREDARPGKPAVLLDIDRGAYHIVGIDLSGHDVFRGAVLDLGGDILAHAEVPLDGALGEDAVAKVSGLLETLLGLATAPVLGVGIGSPGIVDLAGTVLRSANLGWFDLPLQRLLAGRFGLSVHVANDANVAVLAEHSFGEAFSDFMLVKVGNGVGAGLLLDGVPLFGSQFAAGEIGHVVVGAPDGPQCACGKTGCLETWLSIPKLTAALAEAGPSEHEAVLRTAGAHLGIALAHIVGALNLSEIVISGPEELLGGILTDAAFHTVRSRTMSDFHNELTLRMSEQGPDIVVRGSAVLVLSNRLGVS